MKIPFKSVGIMLTKQCTAECDICCFFCSLHKNEKMSKELIVKIIDEAKSVNSISTFGISGGEPFLYLDELLFAISLATKSGFKTTCTTNGFWAVSPKATVEIMMELKKAGLSHLSVSIDEFHLKFVPVDNIKRILKVARQIDLPVFLGSVVTKTSKRLSAISELLGDDLLGFPIVEVPCLPVGRAKEKIKSDSFLYSSQLPAKKCRNMDTIVILPDGSVYPCCSQAGMTSPLLLGSIYNSFKLLNK
ncbi:MAG TPA: radical SAM protein [Sulfurihydrogenibium sp.]|uniref:Radical SAM domain protein n=1 Tax=Caldicellulosiruptor saccharolyticus (strain ATCC 43494 / DSM 8903 / Tp8T 6331) TaxID=351627 RepID=A4XLH9_CALS8|nr:radical SAM protein [Caldicellulosiruptor saccharolyticus]ABP67764.1 Radical SAM domain protein [Caldicellulosiruptor saccharolyticus DSM 8903]HBT98199.1 radical SAM protein [Sulfurihydrogenibium sp.]